MAQKILPILCFLNINGIFFTFCAPVSVGKSCPIFGIGRAREDREGLADAAECDLRRTALFSSLAVFVFDDGIFFPSFTTLGPDGTVVRNGFADGRTCTG
jgi:hypothetical protein